jgi:hypothetical protein
MSSMRSFVSDRACVNGFCRNRGSSKLTSNPGKIDKLGEGPASEILEWHVSPASATLGCKDTNFTGRHKNRPPKKRRFPLNGVPNPVFVFGQHEADGKAA